MAGQRILFMVPVGAIVLTTTAEDTEWQNSAACRGHSDPDIWYSNSQGDRKIAKQFCSRCPVVTECLEYALKYRDPWGLWGGQGQVERKARKRSSLARAATDVHPGQTAEVATSRTE